jgi:hypothetical protein
MSERVQLGDVVVFRGVPPGNNPYGEGLAGDERVTALRAALLDFGTISTRRLSARWSFWHVPYGGQARMLTHPCSEIDWSTMPHPGSVLTGTTLPYPFQRDGSLRRNDSDF